MDVGGVEDSQDHGEVRGRIAQARNALNYETEFKAAGESYSEADEQGNVIIHSPVDDAEDPVTPQQSTVAPLDLGLQSPTT